MILGYSDPMWKCGVVVLGLAWAAGCEFGASKVIDARPFVADGPPADAAVVPPDAPTCPAAPPGCTSFSCGTTTSCYYSCVDKRTFLGSQNRCLNIRDGDRVGCLATIGSAAEQQCIFQRSNPGLPDFVWVGYRQAPGANLPQQLWTWSCGQSAYMHAPWGLGSGEPNDQDGSEDGDENCLGLGVLGAWMDVDCDVTARHVCEFPGN